MEAVHHADVFDCSLDLDNRCMRDISLLYFIFYNLINWINKIGQGIGLY